MPTHEVIKSKRMHLVDKFRAYDTWAECIMDRACFLRANPRYAACFRETTGEG